MNTLIINVDKIKGNLKTSGKGTEYLDSGQIQIGKNTARVSWLRPDKEAIDRGGLVFANLEVNKREDKTYPQLTITGVVPVIGEQNVAYLVGEVVDMKEFNKMVSFVFRYEHTNWSKETNGATVSVRVFDKTSAIASTLRDAKGKGKVFVEAKLEPSNGFIEFVATRAKVLGGSEATEDLATAADVGSEPDPF